MTRAEKTWHPNFIKYMEYIVSHPNYAGMPSQKNKDGSPRWISTAKSNIGIQRIQWAEKKAGELRLPVKPGVYAKVMYALHPSKLKVCQICGKQMSIRYIYPNVHFAKNLISTFGVEIEVYDSIYEVWDKITRMGFTSTDITKVIDDTFGISLSLNTSRNDVLGICEELCRLDGKKHLGPGAMSNFPDRFDGFHSYNRCHRSSEDKGRSKENMKSYTKDRRAYEYWSGGNIHAANQFMGSKSFYKASADHIGPISLGFIHDPHYLRPMAGNLNSAKRDRLDLGQVEDIISIQKKTGVYPMSWYSALIWDYIVQNFESNSSKIGSVYRNMLKLSMSNFMFILREITLIGKDGEDFLVNNLLLSKKEDFLYNYTFDKDGKITSKSMRNLTQRSNGEFDRFIRVALMSVIDYNEKDNRHISHDLKDSEKRELASIIQHIVNGKNSIAYADLKNLVDKIQSRVINSQP